MLITFLCFSAISPMMAQDVKGKIVDEKGQPLAFANVVLLNRQDSAFVKGVVSGEDGHFAIDSPCNNGIIKVTSVGYKTVWKDCAGENAGVIKMMADSKMLGEVVVKSSMPKTILKNGGMTTSPDEKDLQQMTYLDKTWNQQDKTRWKNKTETFSSRLNASYQFDDNNSLGASFSFLRNPKLIIDRETEGSVLRRPHKGGHILCVRHLQS